MKRRNLLILGLLLFAIVVGFLVVLFGTPLLFYFGIFNPAPPSGFGAKPSGSTFKNEVIGMNAIFVKNYSILNNGEMIMRIQNAAQAPLDITEIRINGTPVLVRSPTLPTVLPPNDELTISGSTSLRGEKGNSFTNMRMEINYSIVGGNKHVDSGIMRGYFE